MFIGSTKLEKTREDKLKLFDHIVKKRWLGDRESSYGNKMLKESEGEEDQNT